MPKNPTTTNLPSQLNCHERRHMTAAEFVVYDVARAWSSTPSPDPKYRGKHILYLNGPKIAAESASLGTATVYRVVKSLEAKGWLVKVQNSHWIDGHRTSTHFRVIHHDEWARKHGALCETTKAAKYAQRADSGAVSNSHSENTYSHGENLLSHQESIACETEPVLKPVETTCVSASGDLAVAGFASGFTTILSVGGTHADSGATLIESHSHSENNSTSDSHSENNSIPEAKPETYPFPNGVEAFIWSLPAKRDRVQVALWVRPRVRKGTPPTLEQVQKQFPQFAMEGAA